MTKEKLTRVDFLAREDQLNILKQFTGSISAHIRAAIDDYIKKVMGVSAATSPSKRGVEQHG